jgi:manganese/iron transport system permease protein
VTLVITVLAFAVLAIVFFGRQIMFSTFDVNGYRAAGYREWPIEMLTLVLITATVVSAIPAVGAILAIALIAAPAAAARLISRTTAQMFVIAPVLGAVSGVSGVLLSRALNVAAGPTIALVAAAFFVVALVARRVRGAVRAPRQGEARRTARTSLRLKT